MLFCVVVGTKEDAGGTNLIASLCSSRFLQVWEKSLFAWILASSESDAGDKGDTMGSHSINLAKVSLLRSGLQSKKIDKVDQLSGTSQVHFLCDGHDNKLVLKACFKITSSINRN